MESLVRTIGRLVVVDIFCADSFFVFFLFFLAGQVLFTDHALYLFTLTDVSTFALRTAPAYCPRLYTEICDTVADLPPYSCTVKKHPTFFAVVGTAYANTTFLMSIVIVLFGMFLSRLNKYYPPPGTDVQRSKVTDEELKCDSPVDQDVDVEMAVHSVKNPIQ